MQLCKSSLWDRLKDEDVDPFTVCWQLVEGLRHIHGADVIHRNLTSHNVFMVGQVVKIAVFVDEVEVISSNDDGNTAYRAPKIALDSPFTPKADIYSLGMIFFELFSKFWS